MAAALLFDVDGVLLDSMATYRDAWGRWAAGRGLALATIARDASGRRPIDIIRAANPHLDASAEVARFRRLLASADPVAAIDGAAELLSALPAGRWAVVSSGDRAETLGRMSGAGLPLPTLAVGGDDITDGKPDPSGYRLAAQRLGVDALRCLVVEDAPAGVAAGKRAGMRVVALCTTHRPAQLAQADLIYPTLAAAAPMLLAEVLGQGFEDQGYSDPTVERPGGA